MKKLLDSFLLLLAWVAYLALKAGLWLADAQRKRSQ